MNGNAQLTRSAVRDTSAQARPVYVVLGASNVALGLPILVEELARRTDGAFDLFLAHGHGRSFGQTSRFLARELPSILDCGLWPALDRALAGAGTRPVRAVLADAGNDLIYGSPPELVARWIAECRARLAARGARVTLVGLPRARLERLSSLGFFALRRLFFTRHEITHAVARTAAFALDERLVELGRGAPYIVPPLDWYGLDPIHVRRGARRRAWSAIVEQALAGSVDARAPASLSRAELRALARMCAERRTLFGRAEEHAQPAVRLADGSTVAWY